MPQACTLRRSIATRFTAPTPSSVSRYQSMNSAPAETSASDAAAQISIRI